MVTLSVSVMAHPARVDMLADLLTRLDLSYAHSFDVEIDTAERGIWPTAERCWLRGASRGADFHMIIQEDVLPCLDLLQGTRAALTALTLAGYTDRPVCLYGIRKSIEIARIDGLSWIEIPDGIWGQATILPRPMIGSFLAWCDEHIKREFRYDDSRVCLWASKTGHFPIVTVPSLVEHIGGNRSVIGNPTTFGGRPRLATAFLGEFNSAMDVDWGRGLHPLRRDKLQSLSRYFQWFKDSSEHARPAAKVIR